MNAKTLTKLILSGTALAVVTPALLVRAQDAPSRKKNQTTAEDSSGGFQQKFKRFLEGFGSTLDPEQKKQLDKAMDELKKDEGKAEPGQPREFKWEWRSDGQPKKSDDSAPRKRGRVESAPGGQNQADEMRQQMEKMFPGMDLQRFFGDDFLGPLLREMNRMQRGGAPGADQEEPTQGFPGSRREGQRSARYEKAARRAMAEFRPVVKEARESVVSLFGRDGNQLALATIVTSDGYALTKASMLGNNKGFEAEFSDGRVVDVKVVDTLKHFDLALVKLDAKDLKPIQWNTAENLPTGTLLAAPSPDEDPLAIGVISVPPRSLDSSRKGFLGVGMDGGDGGVKITRVTESSGAEKAGLKVDDVITAVDGHPVRSPKELTDYITSKKADDEVHIGYRRGNEDKVAVAVLKSRDDMVIGTKPNGEKLNETELKELQRQGDPTARMGGRGNAVADGFPIALQNDLLIDANQCGGPAVDIDGKAVGLNIARAERTKTYAIPASAIAKLLAHVDEGKLSEPKDLNDLKRDARKAVEELESLRAKAKEAEDRLKAAQEALDKQGK